MENKNYHQIYIKLTSGEIKTCIQDIEGSITEYCKWLSSFITDNAAPLFALKKNETYEELELLSPKDEDFETTWIIVSSNIECITIKKIENK